MKVHLRLILCLAAVAAGSAADSASAAFVSVEASDNATVQLNGPRTGNNGKAFFNLEGSSYGNFVSFGVADFSIPAPSAPVFGITGATLKLTQSNSSFSTAGPLSVFLTDQTSVSIQPANTSLNYVAGQDGAASVDADLLPIMLLGSGVYTPATNGTVDSIALNFAGGALTSLLTAINSGSPLRLVVTPDAATTAATYAGYTNNTFAGPTLELETVSVPEPTSFVLVGMLLAGLASSQRRWR